MIYTARQLEDLHKSNGHVVLPYGARLTPLAVDWARAKKITVGYSNVEDPKPAAKAIGSSASVAGAKLLWWCDGPCGAAKAAVMSQAKETPLSPIDAKDVLAAVRHLIGEIKAGRVTGGVLLVQTGVAAMLYANRSPVLRAILGTGLESVEQGIQLIAANVLVIEYPNKTLSQLRNMLGRFARAGAREASDEIKRQLAELAS